MPRLFQPRKRHVEIRSPDVLAHVEPAIVDALEVLVNRSPEAYPAIPVAAVPGGKVVVNQLVADLWCERWDRPDGPHLVLSDRGRRLLGLEYGEVQGPSDAIYACPLADFDDLDDPERSAVDRVVRGVLKRTGPVPLADLPHRERLPKLVRADWLEVRGEPGEEVVTLSVNAAIRLGLKVRHDKRPGNRPEPPRISCPAPLLKVSELGGWWAEGHAPAPKAVRDHAYAALPDPERIAWRPEDEDTSNPLMLLGVIVSSVKPRKPSQKSRAKIAKQTRRKPGLIGV